MRNFAIHGRRLQVPGSDCLPLWFGHARLRSAVKDGKADGSKPKPGPKKAAKPRPNKGSGGKPVNGKGKNSGGNGTKGGKPPTKAMKVKGKKPKGSPKTGDAAEHADPETAAPVPKKSKKNKGA